MCSLSAHKKDGNVYKRRKMGKDSNPLTACEEAKETMAQSCTTSDDHSSLVLPVVSSEAMPFNSTANMKGPTIDCEETTGVSLEPNSAFHLSCCIPRIKEPPTDEWYCAPCLCKKPKSPYGKLSEGKVKPSRNTNQRPHGMSHIEYMLKDAEPYVTGVRIGRDFQAEVPEWSGPTSSNDGYFDEPSEFNPAGLTNFNLCKTSNQSRCSIGNWIQCRETLNPGESDKQVVCGKWRRAPLYVVQTDDWECFCCLLWDPAHADCAVPQELKTSEVLKQLKFVNTLKNQLVDKNQKPY
ncbi:unnamed protein product [Urochloa humidicola]